MGHPALVSSLVDCKEPANDFLRIMVMMKPLPNSQDRQLSKSEGWDKYELEVTTEICFTFKK